MAEKQQIPIKKILVCHKVSTLPQDKGGGVDDIEKHHLNSWMHTIFGIL